MPRKVIIFAGAPESHTLNWAGPGLLNHFLGPLAKFAEPPSPTNRTSVHNENTSSLPLPDQVVWRSIPLHQERLRTGYSQNHALPQSYQGTPDFFTTLSQSFDTTSNLSDDEASQRFLDQFYDHSLAIHQDIASSQLPPASFSTDGSSFDTTREGTTEVSLSVDETMSNPRSARAIEVSHLSDLEDIPNARYLQSIIPQTMTVNLIVGIISIAEPRTVKTRWGSTHSLVELLVGDDTKSGFSFTFWLASESSEANVLVRNLRRQDIILVRNVALGVFMKKVHGHSLRKGLTKIDLLHRRRIDKDDQGGLYSMKEVSSTRAAHPQLLKTRKVWEWLINFVGDGGTALGKRKADGRPVRRWDQPPMDTQ
ncbi:hypothetical protein F5Y18DRAFT_394999 [Xylariaceae sp. FL1019]|nr:hypothetical protein F5Y18DRAFT_394999 [Xylariaceae sp. FL1019]